MLSFTTDLYSDLYLFLLIDLSIGPMLKSEICFTIEVNGRAQCALARPLKAHFRIDRPKIDKIDQDQQNQPKSTQNIDYNY